MLLLSSVDSVKLQPVLRHMASSFRIPRGMAPPKSTVRRPKKRRSKACFNSLRLRAILVFRWNGASKHRDCPHGGEKLKRADGEGHYYIKRSVGTPRARAPRQVHPTTLELSSPIFYEAATHSHLYTSELDGQGSSGRSGRIYRVGRSLYDYGAPCQRNRLDNPQRYKPSCCRAGHS
jgi:hypothetical protein